MSNLFKRFLSALVLIPLVLALVFFSSKPFFVSCIAILSGIAGHEFGTMVFGRGHRAASLFLAFLSMVLSASVSCCIYISHLPLASFAFLCFSILLFFMLSKIPLDIALRFAAFSFFGAVYCGILFGFLGLLLPDFGQIHT